MLSANRVMVLAPSALGQQPTALAALPTRSWTAATVCLRAALDRFTTRLPTPVRRAHRALQAPLPAVAVLVPVILSVAIGPLALLAALKALRRPPPAIANVACVERPARAGKSWLATAHNLPI